ncbi:MAG: hypothetical protein DRO23_09520 [Thermoprotei archaeon]|nr:MAG: hypothetical protein DRO23_09520 [Thermoprotei archaeon]
MTPFSRAVFILVLVVAVALVVTVFYFYQILELGSQETPSLVKEVFSSDVFEVEVFYPEHVGSGQEVVAKVFVKGKKGYVVSAVVFKVYSCSVEPRDVMVFELGDSVLVYENTTKLLQPRSELLVTYRFRLPGELGEWLGLAVWVTPVKPGAPMVIHYTEPIVIPVKVEE